MDLAMALAEEVGADIVLANDPDADRCAVGVPTDDGWRMLRGDEVGALLGDFLLRNGKQGTYAVSIVSSSLLGKMAARHGQPYAETLTGFKWIGRVEGLAFGYEEALGYCVAPEVVKDKDGISAAVAVAELADELRAQGRTLLDVLDDLALAHGLYATDQLSVRVADLSRIPVMTAALQDTPPAALGGSEVVEVADLAAPGTGLPPTEGLRLLTADSTRVIVRPSGTEPKLKCYLEVIAPVAGRAALPAARAEAQERLGRVRAELEAALGL